MPLAYIDRSASVGWCPVGHQPFLAAGTQGGAIDMSFSSSSVLEVSTDMQMCQQHVWIDLFS